MVARRDKYNEKLETAMLGRIQLALASKISRKIRDKLGTSICKMLEKIRDSA